MSQQRQKTARRPLVSFPWIGTRLLRFFFLFYGSGVVLLGVCAARAGVGAAAAHVKKRVVSLKWVPEWVYRHVGEPAKVSAVDAVALASCWSLQSEPMMGASGDKCVHAGPLVRYGYAVYHEPSRALPLADSTARGIVITSSCKHLGARAHVGLGYNLDAGVLNKQQVACKALLRVFSNPSVFIEAYQSGVYDGAFNDFVDLGVEVTLDSWEEPAAVALLGAGQAAYDSVSETNLTMRPRMMTSCQWTTHGKTHGRDVTPRELYRHT